MAQRSARKNDLLAVYLKMVQRGTPRCWWDYEVREMEGYAEWDESGLSLILTPKGEAFLAARETPFRDKVKP